MSTGGGLVKIAGVDKKLVRSFYDIQVDPEEWKDFLSHDNGALLGVDLARDRDLRDRYVWRKGKEFVLADLGGISLYFAGTFTPKDPTMRSVILTGDRFLEQADNRLGTVNEVLVRISDRARSGAVEHAVEKLDFPVKLMAVSQQFARDQAAADMAELLRYARDVVLVLGIVILLGLANATSMAVRERVREIGMLRSLGFSRTRIVSLVVSESLILAVAGGVLGCGAAWAFVRFGDVSVPVGGYLFPVSMGFSLALLSVAGAAAVGVLGGLPAGIRASRRPVVDAIRSV